MNKLPLWALEIGPLQNFASFFSSLLQRAQKANCNTNFVILAILTSKGCPTLVCIFKPEGPLLGGSLFYLIELKHRLDDLPQKSNTGSDRSNGNKNVFHMSSWDHWTAFDSDTLPTTTTHNEPATPCAQPSDVKSQNLNERESDVKVN